MPDAWATSLGAVPGGRRSQQRPCGATRTTPTSRRRLETGNLAVARAQSCPTGEEERFQSAGESRCWSCSLAWVPPELLRLRRSVRAANGHATAAPPTPAMNSRRRISHAPGPLYGQPMAAGLQGNGLRAFALKRMSPDLLCSARGRLRRLPHRRLECRRVRHPSRRRDTGLSRSAASRDAGNDTPKSVPASTPPGLIAVKKG
jgi:hypothetical protein